MAFALTFIGCQENGSLVAADDSLQKTETQLIEEAISNIPISNLSDPEKYGIVFMREEEKMARDVYLYFYEKYGMKIFSNIAKREITHMEALKMLLDKYELEDPITNDAIGAFNNAVLAAL